MPRLKNIKSASHTSKMLTASPLALAITSILFAPNLMAEETAATEQETITVLGQTYRNTATKTSLEPEETPQAISVINSDDFENRGVSSVQQALRYAPGVNAELKGGSVTMYDNYNIRGFENNQMYYDGLVLQYLVGWNLQPQIDPIALERVEIFKGPSSVLYGAMPPGGMVNLIAKSPQKERNTDISIATGSRNLVKASIDTTGQFGDSNVYYRLIGSASHRDGQVDYTEEERYVIAPSIDWYVTDNTLVNFNFYYQNDPNMGMNSAMPASGSVWDNPNGSIDKNASMGDKNWSKFEREFWMAGYKIDHSFNENWSFLQNARFMKADLSQKNTYHTAAGWDPTTGDLARNIYSTEESSKGFTIDNQLTGLVNTGAVEHNLLFGVDYQYLTGDSDYQEYGSAPSFNVFSPNNNQINSSSLSSVYQGLDDVRVEQIGVYFQDQMRINRVILMAGGRFDNYQSRSDYSDAYAVTKTDIDQNNFSYRVGAMYEFDSGWSPYINYATSFEPVAGTNSTGKAFDPSIGQQVEGGVKYLSSDYSTSMTASLFHIIKSDVVVTDPTSNNYQDDIQVGEIRSQGLEFEGRTMLTDNWDISASYTYTDMEITEDSTYEGKTPIYVPKNAATLWTNYYVYNGILGGSRFGAGARYIGERQMDAANTDTVPDYTVVDLSLGYDLAYLTNSLQGAAVNLSVNNLFDEDTFTCYDSANCWYGEERTVEFKFDYKF